MTSQATAKVESSTKVKAKHDERSKITTSPETSMPRNLPNRDEKTPSAVVDEDSDVGSEPNGDLVLVEMWWQSQRLESKFRALAENLRDSLSNDNGNHQHEKSRKRVISWRGDVKHFAENVSVQLEYCKSLRENGTMLALLKESPERALRKRSTRIVDQLRSDLVLMHQSDLMQEALARRPPEAQHEIVDLDRIHSFAVFEEQSSWSLSTTNLVERLKRVREEIDLHPSSSATDTTSKDAIESIFDLIELHRDTQAFLCNTVRQRSQCVPSLAHITHNPTLHPDNRSDDQGHWKNSTSGHHDHAPRERSHLAQMTFLRSSRATQQLMHVLGMSDELISQARLDAHYHDEASGVNAAAVCVAEKQIDRFRHELQGAQQEISILEDALKAAKSSEDIRITARDRLQLDETILKMGRMEREFKTLTEQANEMRLSQQVMLSQSLQLKAEHEAMRSAHDTETRFYGPRIRQLQEMLQTTAAALDAMCLDVELISRKYEAICETSQIHELRLSCVETERTQLGTKLLTAIKKMQDYKKEIVRKGKIIATVMAAREELIVKVSESQKQVGDLTNELSIERALRAKAEEELKSAQLTVKDTMDTVAESAARVNEYQYEVKTLRGINVKLTDKLDDNASIGRGRELTVELHKSRKKLEQLTLDKARLEGSLAQSEERSDKLERQIEQLRAVVMSVEGPVDEATT